MIIIDNAGIKIETYWNVNDGEVEARDKRFQLK